MLINLFKVAHLASGNKNTSFHVFLNIRQNISQFMFANVMDKTIAFCYLTIIYLISDNLFFFPVLFFLLDFLSHGIVVRNKINICEGLALASVKHGS